MIPNSDNLEAMRHEHARWATEHGHWIKNLRVWRSAHEKALEAAANIETLVHRFEELVPPFQRDVTLHDEEIRLHSRELADAIPGSKHPGQELHRSGNAEHAREQENHEELRQIHQQIASEVEHMRSAFPASAQVAPTMPREDVERIPEI